MCFYASITLVGAPLDTRNSPMISVSVVVRLSRYTIVMASLGPIQRPLPLPPLARALLIGILGWLY